MSPRAWSGFFQPAKPGLNIESLRGSEFSRHHNMTTLKILLTLLLVTFIEISQTGLAEAKQSLDGRLSEPYHRPNGNEPCCGPISAGARRVLEVLDDADVERLWLPHQHVN